MFSYCFNNPVNMNDLQGKWPKFLKEVGARVKYLARWTVRTITSPLKAAKISVGMGIGLGVKGSTNIKSVKVDIGASSSITDSVSYDKGKFDLKNTTSTKLGITFADKIDFSYSEGKEHSFFDKECTCDILHDPFVKQMKCPANTDFQSAETFIGVSLGAYLGLGGDVSLGIDFKAWTDELIDIFNEPYVGYY